MAASTVAGGIFNAFTFAGASWIFSHVDHGNYQAEQRRHNLAQEAMQKSQELWQRKEVELRDKIERQRIETERADHNLEQGVDALDQYHKLLKEYNTLEGYKEKINNISNFYHPSDEFKNYLSIVKISMIAGIVFVGSKYLV